MANTDTAKFDLNLKSQLEQNSLQAAQAGLNKTLTDTQFTLDSNERAAAITSASLMEAAQRILSSRLANTKVPAEIAQIKAQMENLKQDNRIKKADADLKENNIQPHDKLWQRKLSEFIQKKIDSNKPWLKKNYIPDNRIKKQPSWLPQ